MARPGLMAFVVGIATGTAAMAAPAEAQSEPALVIKVENHANVGVLELEAGLELARRLYRLAGVRTEWPVTKRPVTGPVLGPDKASISVVLLGRGMSSLGTKASVLGVAPPMPADARRHVFIFTERVEKFAIRHDLSLARVLGHVIAHEIGHVLMPGAGHTKEGVMQAVTPARALSPGAAPLLFTKAENHAIHDFISNRLNARQEPSDAGLQAALSPLVSSSAPGQR